MVCKLRAVGIEATVRPPLLLTVRTIPSHFKVKELTIYPSVNRL